MTTAVDALLVLQRSDVAHIAAQRERFDGLRLVFTDAGMLDEAVQLGLKHFEFRRLDPDPDLQARNTTEALALATTVDLALAQERQRHLGPGVLDGWDVGLFFLGLMKLALARHLGAWAERTFAGQRLGLLRPRQVQQFYFDAFVGPDVVAQDPARWAVLDHYDVTRHHRADALASALDADALRAEVIAREPTAVSHVPTCFYDRAWLADELGRVHPRSIDLPSVFWDVPLRRSGTPLMRATGELPPPGADCRAYARAARERLASLLAPWLPVRAAREAQLDFWAARCEWQAANFRALVSAFAGTRPQFLLADQDTGLNGPLFSLAAALGAMVTVVPHSGQPSMVLPHARHVTAVQRAGFAAPVRTVLGQTVPTRHVHWGPLPERRSPSRLRTLCLLLNSLSTEGLSHVDLLGLAAFYKPLARLCETHGVELLVRPKPGSAALSVLAGAFGVPAPQLLQGLNPPLEQLVARTDLCLAVGEPTTAVTHFLHAGALTVQADEQDWPTDFVICSSLVASGLTPVWRYGEALMRIRALLDDESQFRALQQRQASAFTALVQSAGRELFPPSPS